MVDYELGGPGLSDATGGLKQKVWVLRAEGDTGKIYISAPGVAETLLFTAPGVTEVSLAFDQNMRPFVAFVQAGQAKYRWYDTVSESNRISNLDPADVTPRCTMDNKNDSAIELGTNDIILTYVRAGALYYRQQRDRFDTERQLSPTTPGRLMRVGMNVGRRLQWMFEG
jgi:hypothetical protein